MVDLKFCDLLGTWQHMTLPLRALDESAFEEGLGFDGSSIRGWQGISESDMLLMPDADDRDPRPGDRGADALARLRDRRPGHEGAATSSDPRRVAKRAEEYLRQTGIADTCFIGPECEFFVFDEVSYELGPNRAHYSVDSAEGLLELRQARARLHVAAEGGLLPARAARHAARPAHARWC